MHSFGVGVAVVISGLILGACLLGGLSGLSSPTLTILPAKADFPINLIVWIIYVVLSIYIVLAAIQTGDICVVDSLRISSLAQTISVKNITFFCFIMEAPISSQLMIVSYFYKCSFYFSLNVFHLFNPNLVWLF